jgi:Domain of unknown function (DUF5615)
MSSPKMRLLLDESVTNPLAKGILRMSRSAVYVRTHPTLKGKEDPEIANEANREKRIIVALDNDYKGIVVKAGVIKLNVIAPTKSASSKSSGHSGNLGTESKPKTGGRILRTKVFA